jgi:hypothetical protein
MSNVVNIGCSRQNIEIKYLDKKYRAVSIVTKPEHRLEFNKISYNKYRLIGLNSLEKLKKCTIPPFPKKSKLCAIFIDDRTDRFFEFIIRLFIIKLGNDFSHYIVCSDNNYNFMKNMCENISKNINIIKLDTDIEINTQEKYSSLLKTCSFWTNFKASTALIYQSDTYIFNENLISEFIKYDYIGAPWPHQPYGLSVGNGGFSIRNLTIMKEICETHSNKELINDNNLPEDLFFSFYMHNLQKKIPNFIKAVQFSLENVHIIDDLDYYGGHQFWFCLHNWESIIQNNIEKVITSTTI